jgi:hypothetical protein
MRIGVCWRVNGCGFAFDQPEPIGLKGRRFVLPVFFLRDWVLRTVLVKADDISICKLGRTRLDAVFFLST